MPVEVGALAHQAVDVRPLVGSMLARTGRTSVAAGVPGPLEQVLARTFVGGDGAGSVAGQHMVLSFHPCMVCTAH